MNPMEPTPYDLRWRMFGIPVRIHPTFWLFSAFMGWHYQRLGFSYLLMWIACTLVSVLVHELGHILLGLWGGERGEIILFSMGGLAVGQYHRLSRGNRILLYLAGPGLGFCLYGLIATIKWYRHLIFPDPNSLMVLIVLEMLLFMNLFWNAMNLIPVMPLDGGQVMREVLTAISPFNGFYYAQLCSITVALFVVAWAILHLNRPLIWFPSGLDPTFLAILFGLMAVQGIMEFRHKPW